MRDSMRVAQIERLLDQEQAAALLNVNSRTLEAWRQRRIGPRWLSYSRRCVRYRLSDLQAWLTEHEVQTKEAA